MEHHYCCFNGKKHLDFIVGGNEELAFAVYLPFQRNRAEDHHANSWLVEIDDHIAVGFLNPKYFSSFEQRLQIFFDEIVVEVVVIAQILSELCLLNVLNEHFCHLFLADCALRMLLNHCGFVCFLPIVL